MEHTPIPWKSINNDGVIRSQKGDFATVTFGNNAEFIVKAVNAHEALLTACKYVLAVLKQYDTNSPTIPLHTKYIEEILEAALAEKGE